MLRLTGLRARTVAGSLAFLALSGLSVPSLAQGIEPTPTLSLSATGEVSIAPDQATVSAGVVTRADSAAQAVRENAQTMTTVFAALSRAGIAERDMQTSALNVTPIYEDRRAASSSRAGPRIIGYEARNTVSVLVRDIDEVGGVIDSVFEAGANTLNGVQFSSSQADQARDEARRQAVTRLMGLRDLYSDAAGFEVVGLLNFTESFGGRPVAMMARSESLAFDGGTPVAAGELTVSATVSASWEIEG